MNIHQRVSKGNIVRNVLNYITRIHCYSLMHLYILIISLTYISIVYAVYLIKRYIYYIKRYIQIHNYMLYRVVTYYL